MRWPFTTRRQREDRAGLDQLRAGLTLVLNDLAGVDVAPGWVPKKLNALLDGSLPRSPRQGKRGGHMGGKRVDVGETEFLVHGECGCGWRCGCPEGALWPLCPNCGLQVLPPKGEPPDSYLRLGYAAELLPELVALVAVRERR